MSRKTGGLALLWIATSLTFFSYLIAGGDSKQDTSETTRGRTLGMSCAGCHGTDGKSTGIMPAIYGKPSQFLLSELLAFKSGERTATIMGRIAKGYSDEELRLIADYYAGLMKKSN